MGLYRRKVDTWSKTNVLTHISHVTGAGRQRESRLLKLWRDQKNWTYRPSIWS